MAEDRALRDFDRPPPPVDWAGTLKPKARELYDRLENVQRVQPDLSASYVVKGRFEAGSLSVVYGPPKTGKTFLALDIAHAVQSGAPRWGGQRVRQGNVLYVATETGTKLRNRIAAFPEPSFWLLPGDFTVNDRAEPLGEAVRLALQPEHGPFQLIVIDTMARSLGGADENSGAEMGEYLRKIDRLRDLTGAHVMLVHHTGKDRERGMRGHSSIEAHVDTFVRVERDKEIDGRILATWCGQRDEEAGAVFAYRLSRHVLGKDEDGDPVTTCRVQSEEAAHMV